MTAAAPEVELLVVDDDAGLRREVAAYLSEHEYRVHEAQDVRAMRRVLDAHPVALVLLDVMLPGEGGLSACRRLSEQADAPPVLMLSALGDAVDGILGLELGADDHLVKSVNPRELLGRGWGAQPRTRRPAPAAARGGRRLAGPAAAAARAGAPARLGGGRGSRADLRAPALRRVRPSARAGIGVLARPPRRPGPRPSDPTGGSDARRARTRLPGRRTRRRLRFRPRPWRAPSAPTKEARPADGTSRVTAPARGPSGSGGPGRAGGGSRPMSPESSWRRCTRPRTADWWTRSACSACWPTSWTTRSSTAARGACACSPKGARRWWRSPTAGRASIPPTWSACSCRSTGASPRGPWTWAGWGLGLSVSRSVARAHGGDVRLRAGGPGLVAVLRLPLPAAAAPGRGGR